MQTAIISNRVTEGARTETVISEGVELLIHVNTMLCDDGVMRDIADPFVQVRDAELGTISLALSDKHRVSDQGVRDAILAALTPNRYGDD